MKRRIRVCLVGVVGWMLAIAACKRDDGPASPPLTLAERCTSSCATPTDKENPCAGRAADPTCQQTCESSVSDKDSGCADCLLAASGWRGTTCSCAKADFLGSIACSKCEYSGTGRGCSVDLIDKCTDGQKTCDGYFPTAPSDPICAAKCGVAPDAGDRTAALCDSACTAPTDPGDPCHQGWTSEQKGACLSTCTTRLRGASDACATCYLSHSPWLGTTCSCSGTDCNACNWYGNVAGSRKSCGPAICSSGTDCKGFQDIGLDDATCAALCGAPPPDAGSDASDDDANDASEDHDITDAASDG